MYRTNPLPAGAPTQCTTNLNTFAVAHKFKTLYDQCMNAAAGFTDEGMGVPAYESILSAHEHATAAAALADEVLGDTKPRVIPSCCVTNRVFAYASEYNRVELENLFVDSDPSSGALPRERVADVQKLTYGFRHYTREDRACGEWRESPRRFWGGLMLNVMSHRLGGRTIHYKLFNESPCVQIFSGSLRESELGACLETLMSIVKQIGGENSLSALKFALPRPVPYKFKLSLENAKLDIGRSCKHIEAFRAALEADLQCYKHLTATVYPILTEPPHVARGRIHIKTGGGTGDKATISLARTGRGLISATSYRARFEAWIVVLELLRLYPQYWRVNSESLCAHMRAQNVSPTNVVLVQAQHPRLSMKLVPTSSLKRARKTLFPTAEPEPEPEQQQPSATAACSSSARPSSS